MKCSYCGLRHSFESNLSAEQIRSDCRNALRKDRDQYAKALEYIEQHEPGGIAMVARALGGARS